jgi:hypothetical protein
MKKKKPLQCAFSTEEAFKTNGVCPHEQTLFEKSLIAGVGCVKPIFHSFRLFIQQRFTHLASNLAGQNMSCSSCSHNLAQGLQNNFVGSLPNGERDSSYSTLRARCLPIFHGA